MDRTEDEVSIIGLSEARAQLSKLVHSVTSEGQEVIITWNRLPVAKIVPFKQTPDPVTIEEIDLGTHAIIP